MLIGGFQKFSLIDFPQKTAALIFTQGCPFLCHFCHNPKLVVKNQFSPSLNEADILTFLQKRKNQLDAVVITGGEPAIQKDLIDFIKKIKALNYLVKLDTNGVYPHIIKNLLNNNLIDYIAMDIKAPLDKYKLITQKNVDINLILESINLILSSNIEYEFRTTLVKKLHQFEDVEKMAKLIKKAKLYILQKFIPKVTLNPNFSKYSSFCENELLLMKKTSEKHVKKCLIR